MDHILVDDNHTLMNREGMFYKEFPSDYRQIRYFTLLIIQKAPHEIRELNLLEQQVSELIKNGVKHGNRNDPNKHIRVWFSFDSDHARIIIEDEGEGFKNIDQWNAFNTSRNNCLLNEDYEKLTDFVSYRTERSDEHDGGNAMFAALEYWDEGVVFTKKANCVAVGKTFQKNNGALELG